jgi:hypothetical protein
MSVKNIFGRARAEPGEGAVRARRAQYPGHVLRVAAPTIACSARALSTPASAEIDLDRVADRLLDFHARSR